MAITNFIPEIWNASMLENFRETAIFAGLSNREYEGDAVRGNTVHVSGVVDVTVKDYKAAGRTTSADAITDTGLDILIDQEKSFDFYVDDIDRAQAAGSLEAYTRSAANGITEDADKFLSALLVAEGTAVTPGAAPTNAESAWNVVRDLRKALNKASVPQGERVGVVNAEFAALLEEYDSKLTKANESGDTRGLRDAYIGRILGIDMYSSENLPETDEVQIVAWHRSALAFVSQISETEAMRAENKFADRLRGLHVYGGKVVRPTAVVTYTGTPTP